MSENLPMPVEVGAVDMPEQWNRRGDVVLAFAENLEVRWRIANMLVTSGMIRQKRAEEVMAIQLKAYEMGVPLMQALGGMYFIDGKVALEGHLMDALAIQRCGVTKTIIESNDVLCKLVLHREGWEDLPTEYTIEDAALAGLVRIDDKGNVTTSKKNWQRHRKTMLYWRALSQGLRQIAPDYFGGTYTLDELEAEIRAQPAAMSNVGTDAEIDELLAKGTEPVEPDVDVFSEDEMDAAMREFTEARKAKVITKAEEQEFAEMLTMGQWAVARMALDDLRSKVLREEA